MPAFVSRFSIYPNPFNSQTIISYLLKEQSRVLIEIYDIGGRKIRSIYDKEMPPGEHMITWNAGNLPSGVYFTSIQNNSHRITKRTVLVK
jgi:hypothetical protein